MNHALNTVAPKVLPIGDLAFSRHSRLRRLFCPIAASICAGTAMPPLCGPELRNGTCRINPRLDYTKSRRYQHSGRQAGRLTRSLNSMKLIERLRSRRLASAFLLLATLSAAIVAGSFAAHGVRGQEKQSDSADATPLKVVNSTTPPNDFVQNRQAGWARSGQHQHPDPAQAVRPITGAATPISRSQPNQQNPGDDDQDKSASRRTRQQLPGLLQPLLRRPGPGRAR